MMSELKTLENQETHLFYSEPRQANCAGAAD